MRRFRNLLPLALIVGGLAAAGIAPAISQGGADVDAILGLEREWAKRFAQKDVDWIVAAHTSDAQQFPSGAPPVVGSEALRAAWQGMADTEGLSLTWEPTKAFVSSSGDMAWDYGTGKLTNPGAEPQDVKYVVVWHKIDGEWKIVMDMFGPNGE